jgi:hypothetical protein
MYPDKLRRFLTFALVATFLAVPSFAAGKRRAAAHPAAGGQLVAESISGTVLDNGTGQPIVSVKVKAGRDSDTTDAAGKFELKNVVGYNGFINVEITRSGYTSKTVKLTTGGKQTLSIRLDPTPTVHVRKTDGTVYDIDLDSVEFGYVVPFSGYRSETFEDFCKADGTSLTVDRAQLRRVTGPAVTASGSACCPTTDSLRVNIELKTGEKLDVFFVDACNGYPNIDFIGRDHSTAKFQYIAFRDVAEITFP